MQEIKITVVDQFGYKALTLVATNAKALDINDDIKASAPGVAIECQGTLLFESVNFGSAIKALRERYAEVYVHA